MSNPSIASIPLLCNICPKKPKFSDVSHLLTHVSSKAHLSHYYKVRVRGGSEAAAREQVAAYDRWYEDYGVEHLMSQRMHFKDKKKARNGKKATQTSSTTASQSVPKTVVLDDFVDRSNDHLDPRLSDENKAAPAVNGFPMTTASQHKAHIPRMHLWPTSREQMYDTPTAIKSSETESDGQLSYGTPTMESNFDPFVNYSPKTSPIPFLLNSCPAASEDAIGDAGYYEEADQLEPLDESTKLKGVFWPGMALFDSATPEMRRKRNQKKDGSILEQMKLSSVEVEPTELIFTPDGSLKKERRISGLVEEDSPIQAEKPPPKKRVKKEKRPVLAEMSANDRAGRDYRTEKSSMIGSRLPKPDLGAISKRALAVMEGWPVKSGNSRHSSRCTFDATEDEEEEFRLTVGKPRKDKKRSFTIFEDTDFDMHNAEGAQDQYSPHHGSEYGVQPFAYPHGLTLLNSGFPTAPPVEITAAKQWTGRSNRDSATPLPRISSSRMRGGHNKENIEPLMNRSGQIDTQGGRGERVTQRYFSVEGAYPPQFYHNIPPSMTYRTFSGPDLHGFSPNPLCSSNQQPRHSHQMYYPRVHRELSRDFITPNESLTEGSRTMTEDTNSRASSADIKEDGHTLYENKHA